MAEIRLDNLTKRFGSIDIIHGIDLMVQDGEFVVLVGPSGCGKTTTLRMIAGLEDVSGGSILFDGVPVEHLEPKDRDIAMVFQSYALYPHMTVRGNLTFSLRLKGIAKEEREKLVLRAARMLDIEDLLDRKPRQLSGGQRQRVAMGRALVREPAAFLFDEPLSNLDAALRAQMRVEIKKIHHRLGTTMVYVTHDQIEAMTLADRIVVMNKGNIEQVGTPQELYGRPANRFVAGFIGSPKMNFLPGRLVEDGAGLLAQLPGNVRLSIPSHRTAAYRPYIGRQIELGLRPEHLTDETRPTGPNAQFFEVTVEIVEPVGASSLVAFALEGREYVAQGQPLVNKAPGERLTLQAAMDEMHLIDVESGDVVPVPAADAPQQELIAS